MLKEINGNEAAGKLKLKMIFDSGLPSNMWDLPVKTAVYVYNRTPLSSLDIKIPISKLAPNCSFDFN